MTKPASTDARGSVSAPTPKLPHERDETHDGNREEQAPEIQKAYEDATSSKSDTTKGAETDSTYNKQVVPPDGRHGGADDGNSDPAKAS